MTSNLSFKAALKIALWSLVSTSTSIVLASVIGVVVSGWDWSKFTLIFRDLGWAFLIVVIFVFALTFVLAKFPKQTFSISLITLGVFFLMASYQGSPISLAIKNYMNSVFDINYLSSSIAILAFLIAVMSLQPNKRVLKENRDIGDINQEISEGLAKIKKAS